MFFVPGPASTSESERIFALPQRDAEATGAVIADLVTDMLKLPGGTMKLRPLQALALVEAHDHDGLFCILGVGGGKTPISLLLPVIMSATNPVLIVPAALRDDKTRRDFAALAEHFRTPAKYTILSYEEISTKPGLLESIGPDLIVADECHKLKNPRAACTKRVWRYWYEAKHPVKMCFLSGTIVKRSFADWWHLQLMALPEGHAILPYKLEELRAWSAALDEKPALRSSLGVLKNFGRDIDDARKGFGEFIRKIPAVISSSSVDCKSSIYLHVKKCHCPIISEALKLMSKTAKLPNGEDIASPAEMWRHAKTLSNGFYYHWTTPPPEKWLQSRKKCCRIIQDGIHYKKLGDTASEVMKHLEQHPAVIEWLAVEPTYKPVTEAIWLSEAPLDNAIALAAGEGIIWYEHGAVAEKLHEKGIMTFRNKGLAIPEGTHFIEDTKRNLIAASAYACSEGYNLQRHSRNILLSIPPGGTKIEQLIGRTHRYGQEADTVEVYVPWYSYVQYGDFRQAVADARYIESTTGQQQKLTIADIVYGDSNEQLGAKLL